MNLLEKSLKVREVFETLQPEMDHFASQSGVSCIKGCGVCCSNPKVSASILEFLPLAFDLYYKKKAAHMLQVLDSVEGESYCVMLKKISITGDAGHCTDYKNRGLICRLFASAARRNKTGGKELLICGVLKEQKAEAYEAATFSINNGLNVPLGSEYYTRLYSIDFHLTQEQFPINIAIRKAIEEVQRYFYYTEEETAV